MKRIVLQIFLTGTMLATSGWADLIITSGSVSSHVDNGINDNGSYLNNIAFSGANFSIMIADGGPGAEHVFPVLPGGLPGAYTFCTTPTCSYDFTQQALQTGVSRTFNYVMSVTDNGVTYSEYGFPIPYTILLTLNFSSSNVTVPNNIFAIGMGQSPDHMYSATWQDVPFTVTGSFSILNGSTVLASDTLSGSGTAGGSYYWNTLTTGWAETATYTFTSTPEPAPAGIVGCCLLLLAWIGRRRCRLS